MLTVNGNDYIMEDFNWYMLFPDDRRVLITNSVMTNTLNALQEVDNQLRPLFNELGKMPPPVK